MEGAGLGAEQCGWERMGRESECRTDADHELRASEEGKFCIKSPKVNPIEKTEKNLENLLVRLELLSPELRLIEDSRRLNLGGK